MVCHFPIRKVLKGQIQSPLGYFYPEENYGLERLAFDTQHGELFPSLQTMSSAFSKSRNTPIAISFLDKEVVILLISLTM